MQSIMILILCGILCGCAGSILTKRGVTGYMPRATGNDTGNVIRVVTAGWNIPRQSGHRFRCGGPPTAMANMAQLEERIATLRSWR